MDGAPAGASNQFEPSIIHGDYHLANVMFRYEAPELAAIVDWELVTIGDPLVDLGWVLATWPDPSGPVPGKVDAKPWSGFPTAGELVEHYSLHSGRDVSGIAWHKVLACYKLGIVNEGTHARARLPWKVENFSINSRWACSSGLDDGSARSEANHSST